MNKCLIIIAIILGTQVAWSQRGNGQKSFNYYPQADTLYTASSCLCQIPENKDIQAPPQVLKDTVRVYQGDTPKFQSDVDGFDVIVLDTVLSPPPCRCPRIPNDFEAEQPQSNHTIGGVVTWSYTFIHNRVRAYTMGYASGWDPKISSQKVSFQATQMDKPFYEDPVYYGLRIGWAANEGELEIEDEEREMVSVGMSTQHLVVGGVYGVWWQWESGFQLSLQFALGYPVISEVDFTNPNGIRDDKFEDGTEFERQGYQFLSYFQGSGLSIGWTF